MPRSYGDADLLLWGSPGRDESQFCQRAHARVQGVNRRSVQEIVDEDLTGFIVEDEISGVSAVGRIGQLDRQKVRQRFEERFTARRMALDYLSAYRSILLHEAPHLKVIQGAE